MLESKVKLVQEMDELQQTINMYQEAFPENPVFKGGAKKKAAPKQAAKQEVVEVPAQQVQPQVDIGKVIEETLSSVADTVIVNYLRVKHHEEITGASPQVQDALQVLYKSFEGVVGYAHDSFNWRQAREEFVETFTRYALKSQMQVGQSKQTFGEIHQFVETFR